jgi:hypothetical protein
MKHLLCCLAIGLPQFLFAQFLYNPYFAEQQLVPCPFDNNQTILEPVGWRVYQTTNDAWDGPYDSTRCISVEPNFASYGFNLPLDQIDPEKPVFIKALLDVYPSPQPFEKNWLYNHNTCFELSPNCPPFLNTANCTQDICSGVFIGIAIPDSMGNPGATTRYQTGLAHLGNASWPNFCTVGIENCFPTEKFDQQYLRDYVIKLSFPPGADLSGHKIFFHLINLSQVDNSIGYLTNVEVNQFHFNNGIYTIDIQEAGNSWTNNYLMLYTDPGYPSAQNPSYVEAKPNPNTPLPQTILLTVNEFQNLDIQPFTYFRGALVEGSDSVRHQAILVNNGGELCFNFIDLIFNGGDEFRHQKGVLSMHNPFSCMQFRDKSALRVTEGATLHYGQDGAGMLALCTGGTLAIERNATLVIDAILNLSECSDNPTPQQIYMDLLPGARLVFTENARLTNRFSVDQQMKLNVRMLGGTIQDELLAPADKALIVREYPVVPANWEDQIDFFPNPVAEQGTLRYISGTAETVLLEWIDITGRTLLSTPFQAQKGMNEWPIQTPEQAGFYFLRVSAGNNAMVKKIQGL